MRENHVLPERLTRLEVIAPAVAEHFRDSIETLTTIRDGMSALLREPERSTWLATCEFRLEVAAAQLRYAEDVAAIVSCNAQRALIAGRDRADAESVAELVGKIPSSWSLRLQLAERTGVLPLSWYRGDTLAAQIDSIVFVMECALRLDE